MAATGMIAGAIDVLGDGTYTCTPPAVGFADPSTASSMAQAIFEQVYPLITNDTDKFPLAAQAQVVNAKTVPPTTAKGNVLIGMAAQAVATAAAVVGYMQANAVADVTTQSLGVLPSSLTSGTPISPPLLPVLVPVK